MPETVPEAVPEAAVRCIALFYFMTAVAFEMPCRR